MLARETCGAEWRVNSERTVLITGGAGFFGGILKSKLLEMGIRCVSIDLQPDPDRHPNLQSILGDIRDVACVERTFASAKFDAVFHCAAVLAHGSVDSKFLWSSNVEGTRNVAEMARRYHVPRLVYTSSNCLWGSSVDHAIAEDESPAPVEIYGRSKLAAERVLNGYKDDLFVSTIRCPTIMDAGRLGLLAILYEFIREDRRVWTIGDGSNRYQFIYAQDLAQACIQLLGYNGSDVFHIGADDVKPMCDIYRYVIREAGSKSRVCALPKWPAIAAMKAAYYLKISPLGPYHYKMIAESFLFDTTKIKQKLGWKPTLTNEDMLLRAYKYYIRNLAEIAARTQVSPHRRVAPMGVIRLLKWVS